MSIPGDWRVTVCSQASIDNLIRTGHYLGKWPAVVVKAFALLGGRPDSRLLFDDIEPIGAAVFSMPPAETIKRYGVGAAWELARFFIIDGTPKNSESWFLSRTLKAVRGMADRPDVIVSYADPAHGHTGVIYRASNWIFDGMTDEGRKPRVSYFVGGREIGRKRHIPRGVQFERRPRSSKFRFLYWTADHEQRRQEARRITQEAAA